ncbi:MAG: aromatic ring-hydroxylating dioxygenase subunit alpha [Actinomycetota bacterium]|nr:aromatic ring-hydroxylating dioxygenase subunit alpha [Actinomycetota bacterium]
MTVVVPPSAHDLDVATLAARREPGLSLEAPFYTSEEIYQADIAAVFAKQWIFAGSEAEIPDEGDYVTVNLGTYSVIIVRDDDGEVRALHNVCRHRGARILNDASGSVGNLVCGYHHWTYATDGRLRHAAAHGKDFDATCFGLKKVALKVASGLIFICLADEPPEDFASTADVISPYIAPHDLSKTKVAVQLDLIEDGNWKLVMENNRECYHCDGHPELACSLFPTFGYGSSEIPPHLQPAHDRYLLAQAQLEAKCEELGLPYIAIEELKTRVAGFRIQREALDGAGESFSETGKAVSNKLLGDLEYPRLGRLSLHLQPNSWFHFLSDHAVTFAVLPLSAGRTLVRTTWLVHQDAEEGIDYDLSALTKVWRETNAQDATFVAHAQLGAASPAYEPGPYMPSEYQVEAFCTWYIDRLQEHLAS